jgi:tetratricopeptide (TPR) repeat protein
MAPERFRGHSDTRSDVYGLGVTLYELLTLKPAFDSHDRVRLIQQVTQVSAARPRKLDPRIPRDIETIVLKAIDKDPCARYASAGELAEDLRRYLADRPIRARRSAVWERGWRWCRRNPVVAVLLSTVAALLVAAIVILAEVNARIRSEVAAKDAAITTAHQAVEHMLTRVANNKLSDVPLAHPLRESLLKDAVAFYEGFVSQGVAGVSIRENMATTLHELGAIQRDLARYDDARQSFERTIDLRRGLVAMNPLSPGAREKLADAQAALAFTVWQIRTGPAGASDREAESRFLEAVETYSSLERDWPDRRQPIGQCLRQLARLASQRGEKSRTEQLLREAIAKEEAFLEQHPDRTNSRIDLCWAYAQLDEEVLKNSPTRLVEAEQVLKTGLRNVELVLDENSRSKSARDVAAYLQIALGRCYSKMNRIEDAVHLFEAAADQIGSLCAEFPWNEEYWRNACFFHRESVKCLQQTGQADEAQRFVRHVARWFREAAPQVPNDPGPQAGVRRCAESLIALLRTTGQHDEADHLAKFAPSHEPK